MRQTERATKADRVVLATLVGGLTLALAGCGEEGKATTMGAVATSTTSAGSSTSTTSAGTASNTSNGSGSTTTTRTSSPAPTPPPPKMATPSSLTLAWVPPTQNSDGSPITNLAGYKIHFGTSSSEYTQTIAVQNAGLTRYVVDNLSSGTYYFAITAYNSQGVESSLSGEIATTLN